MKNLYDEGRHYDLLMLGPRDLPFYQQQVHKYGEPVLELGCGTGRLTVPLRLAGVDITGLDNAPAMLEAARSKAESSGVAIEFVQADARAFSLDRTFRLILIVCNSLSHLLRRDEVEACFRCVGRHLAADGRFVVDVFTPSLHFLARDASQSYPVGEYEDPDGHGHVTVTETGEYDPATQVKHSVWHYSRYGTMPAVWDVSMNMRMFYPQEIDALLNYNGFAIEHKYGDFEGTPFDARSPKQIIVCRR